MDGPALSRTSAAGVSLPAGKNGTPVPWTVPLRHWGVVIAWMGVISFLSSDAFSARNTGAYLDPFLRYLFPGITGPGIVLAHAVVRKAAHFGEFLVLSGLAFWAFRSGRMPYWSVAWMVKALLLAGLFAAVDEGHQAFTMSRTASPFDVGIDFLGAAAGQVMVYASSRLRIFRQAPPP